MFKTGDTVIHPAWVVCKIKDVQNSLSDDKNDSVYILKPYKMKDVGDFKILVTMKQIKQSGIRRPVKEKNIPEIFDVLEEKPNDLSTNRDDIYSLMKEKLSRGDLCNCAEVLRDMKQHNNLQGSYMHRELLESARKILVEEIAYVKGESRTQINRLIDNALSKKY